MVRYKCRYALVFIDPPLKMTDDKLQHILREHFLDLFGTTYSEMIQSMKIMYYHKYTGTLIIKTRLMFINELRVGLLYFAKYQDFRFESIVQHVSATMKQLGKVFEQKIRQYILYNAHKCDTAKMSEALMEIMANVEDLKINS